MVDRKKPVAKNQTKKVSNVEKAVKSFVSAPMSKAEFALQVVNKVADWMRIYIHGAHFNENERKLPITSRESHTPFGRITLFVNVDGILLYSFDASGDEGLNRAVREELRREFAIDGEVHVANTESCEVYELAAKICFTLLQALANMNNAVSLIRARKKAQNQENVLYARKIARKTAD